MQEAVKIHVQGATSAERNRLTGELQEELARRVSGIQISRQKANLESQDAGAVLVAVLAAPAIVELTKGPLFELAKGVADWMRKRNATIIVEKDGGIRIEDVRSEAVLDALKQVLAARNS